MYSRTLCNRQYSKNIIGKILILSSYISRSHVANNHEGICIKHSIQDLKHLATYNYIHIFSKNIFSGLKKYVCDSCGKAFALGYQLKKHIEQVHEGKIYFD